MKDIAMKLGLLFAALLASVAVAGEAAAQTVSCASGSYSATASATAKQLNSCGPTIMVSNRGLVPANVVVSSTNAFTGAMGVTIAPGATAPIPAPSSSPYILAKTSSGVTVLTITTTTQPTPFQADADHISYSPANGTPTTSIRQAIDALSRTFSGFAQLVSPIFTGTPEAPTPTKGISTSQIATTAFVARDFVARDNAMPELSQFGVVDRTGVTDMTAVFQNAANTTLNGQFRVNPGTYLINGTVTNATDGCGIHFPGEGGVTIKSGSATGDLFYFTGAKCSFAPSGGVSFTHAVTRTAGADIHLARAYQSTGPFYSDGAFWGVEIDGNAPLANVNHPQCRNLTPESSTVGAACVRVGVTGSNESSTILNPFCDVDVTTSLPTACIYSDDSDALQIVGANALHARYTLYLFASSGQSINSTQIIGGFYDTPGEKALYALTSGTGNITRINATNAWFGDAGIMNPSNGIGIYLSQNGTGVFSGFSCVNCQVSLNGNYGFSFFGAISDIHFVGGCVTGANYGFVLGANLTGFSLNAMRVGSCDNAGSLVTGVAFFGAAGRINISDVDFAGSTTPVSGLSNLSASANSKIKDNIGYNPVGGASVTVGASPYTWTNGPSPSTVYALSGNASAVTVGGMPAPYNSGGISYQLGPYEAITITYTAAPTMFAFTH
jgi:hypothetical protein